MKILIIYDNYQQPTGEYEVVEAEATLLQAHGHEVVRYTKDNAVIEHYGAREKALFFPRTVFSAETYNEVRQLVQRERPDVAHVHNVFPLISPAVYRALQKAGVPIVQTVHNFRFLCPNGRFYTQGNVCERCKYGNTVHAVRFKCYKDSRSLSALYALTIGVHRQWKTFDAIDCFIAPTEFPAQKLVESGLVPREKISILGNFLLDPLPAAGSFEHREPYVAFLGRLLPEKGAETVVKAMAGLPGLGLKIMGGGVQTDALKAMVRDQQLSKVEFLGHVVGEEKYDILRRATATVVPSLCYETFSLAALESLAVGTPVVASNRGSLPFVVEKDQSGLLFRAGDVADLQAKLTWLVEHPSVALQYGCHARKSVEERFTAALHYEKLMDIYNVVIH